MATLSTHLLNSTDGSHAGHVGICVFQVHSNGQRLRLLDKATDSGGRFTEAIELPMDSAQLAYEMVIQSGAYFAANGLAGAERQIVKEIVIRFAMPDPQGSYHIPLMIAPHSYSVWWSA
jgi:5-hydroxyisourate hydrolase